MNQRLLRLFPFVGVAGGATADLYLDVVVHTRLVVILSGQVLGLLDAHMAGMELSEEVTPLC